jgi:putative oxidoreductase
MNEKITASAFSVFCSVLILIGLSVRVSAMPLLIIILTAIITTKVPILLDKGFLSTAHEARTDLAMTTLLIYLLIYGSGKWSIDSKFNKSLKT